MSPDRRSRDQATVVTSAGRSGTEDRRLRQRRYAITQAARVACFLLAVLLPVPLWARLVLVVGAFTLPWIGVIAANAGPIVQKRSTPQAVPISPGRTIDVEP